eukprot:CAMPEP_0182428076 /NCGR_PEP_ID=MMETSP1167-20130531/20998_1 /TAXON_ID=2988 /ORGANISM="Mallomonas Sp, Strain CCMP3275" /LENGTH=293 /DNA_ID=CAMNT_0024610731 /DNA_START=282 /DNA_END=1163 /DNA_ORIENTATION=-
MDEAVRDSEFSNVIFSELSIFLSSPSYHQWRSNQNRETILLATKRIEVIGSTLPELPLFLDFPETDFPTADASVEGISSTLIKSIKPCEIDEDVCADNALMHNPAIAQFYDSMSTAEKVTSNFDPAELPTIMRNHRWLITLMSAVETMPFSVTLSKVFGQGPKMIMVCCNQHFEEKSGKKCVDLIGQPGTLLQTETTLRIPGQALEVRKFLKSIQANEVRVGLLRCKNHNGTLFPNMIGVKPVYDKHSCKVSYLLTFQIEVKKNSLETIERMRKFVTNLLDALRIENEPKLSK